MNLSDKLNIGDILHQTGNSAFLRGKDYHSRGMVTELALREDGEDHARIVARTRGSSYRSGYVQDIRLQPDAGGGVEIDGDCSCPMDHNCKHIAAVCLNFIARRQRRKETEEGVTEAEPPGVTSSADTGETKAGGMETYMNWLYRMNDAARPDTRGKGRGRPALSTGEWIAYLLDETEVAGEYTVELKVTRCTRNGHVNKGRNLAVDDLVSSWNAPACKTSLDVLIGKMLQTSAGYRVSRTQPRALSGRTGGEVLSIMLETGRCYWKQTDGVLLGAGEPRPLTLGWDEDEEGNVRPQASAGDSTRIILTEPLYYVDMDAECMGVVESKAHNVEQLALILEAPSIPAGLVDDLSEKLLGTYAELALPPPRALNIVDLGDVAPIPCLTLHGGRFMTLYFLYADHPVHPNNEADRVLVRQGDNRLRIHRDKNAEYQAEQCLYDAGFGEILGEDEEVFGARYLDAMRLEGGDGTGLWLELIEEELPKLEQQGWQIKYAGDFDLRFEDADDWEFRVEESESGYDWFDLHFDMTVEGKRLPLMPVVAQIIENLGANGSADELPDPLLLEVEDGHYVKLPAQRIQPVVDNLLELFAQQGVSSTHGLEISRFDAPKLNRLAQHSETGWRGAEDLQAFGERLSSFEGIREVKPAAGLNAELRDYQQSGLNWLQFLREYQIGGVLADDMGLGKTIQTLAHLQIEKEQGRLDKPVLIIAPTSLMGNWRREAERFTPELRVLTLQGHDRKTRFKHINEHDLILSTYPLLTRDGKVLRKHHYHSLILDEAQILKNPRSKAAQMIRTLEADHRLALTGTPMENHLGELWALFDFLIPGFLGDSRRFSRVYRRPIEKDNDQQRREDLSRRIAPFMLRRKKSEVAEELPGKTEILRSIAFDDEQAMLYESIRLTMEKKVRDSIAARGLANSHITILDALLKLRQTCCDPRLLPLERAKKVKKSAKMELLMQLLPEQLEEGRRILLFSQFTKMLGLIEKELQQAGIAYSKLTGQTRKRDAAIERFTSGEADVFLISLKAGGVGLNLAEADTVIHYDPWWNPAVEAQATDRAHRIGQQNPVFVYKLIVENSVEEKIVAMQENKRALAEGVYQGTEDESKASLSAADLQNLFEPLQSGSR